MPDETHDHPLAAALLAGGNADAGARTNSRAALIDAAIAEFAANGYEATTVAAVAQRAGVTTGAVYAHFRGKLDLLLAAIGLTPIGEVARSADDVAALPRSTTAAWLRRALAAAPDQRMVLLLDVIVLARRDQRIARALQAGLAAYVAATTRVVEAATAAGGVTPVIAPDDVARLLSLVSLGRTVFAALEAPPPSPEAFARIGDVLLQPVDDDDTGNGDDENATLARVRARAAAVRHAENDLHAAIAAAVDAGNSLRQVGTAANLSHEGIRRILHERG